jgi:hypothetical protein
MTSFTIPIVAFVFNLAGPDLVIILLILVMLGFPIWMLIDCIKHESNVDNNKLIWLLVILLAPLGSLIYFFARKLSRPPKSPPLPPPGPNSLPQ